MCFSVSFKITCGSLSPGTSAWKSDILKPRGLCTMHMWLPVAVVISNESNSIRTHLDPACDVAIEFICL